MTVTRIKFLVFEQSIPQYVLRIFGLIALIYIALITCWISDDAQITFRQILNFINGDGITFNFGERVQAFSHPLWFILLSGIVAVTRELYVTVSLVSILISTLAILLYFRLEKQLTRDKLPYISPIFFLIFSWAFCDYMTSGLENTLSFLLVSILLSLLFHKNSQITYNIYLLLSHHLY